MGYPKKHRGRRKMGSKKRRARKKNKKNKFTQWIKFQKLNPLAYGYL